MGRSTSSEIPTFPDNQHVVGTSARWECRHVFREGLPDGLNPEGLTRRFRPVGGAIEEIDQYLVAKAKRFNIKLRERTDSLKLKTLLETTHDGLELWRADRDDPLPTGPGPWRLVLDILGCAGDPVTLGRAVTVGETIGLLERDLIDLPRATIRKSRWLFADGGARIDAATITLGNERLGSIAVESESRADVRSTLEKLAIARLGLRLSYMELLDRALRRGAENAGQAAGAAPPGSRRPSATKP